MRPTCLQTRNTFGSLRCFLMIMSKQKKRDSKTKHDYEIQLKKLFKKSSEFLLYLDFFGWLIMLDWLIDWLINWVIDWLIDSFAELLMSAHCIFLSFMSYHDMIKCTSVVQKWPSHLEENLLSRWLHNSQCVARNKMQMMFPSGFISSFHIITGFNTLDSLKKDYHTERNICYPGVSVYESLKNVIMFVFCLFSSHSIKTSLNVVDSLKKDYHTQRNICYQRKSMTDS